MSDSGEKSQRSELASARSGWVARAWSAFVDHTSRGVRVVIASVTALAVSSAALLYGLGLLGSDDSPTSPLDRPYVTGRSDDGPIFIDGQPVWVGPSGPRELLGVDEATPSKPADSSTDADEAPVPLSADEADVAASAGSDDDDGVESDGSDANEDVGQAPPPPTEPADTTAVTIDPTRFEAAAGTYTISEQSALDALASTVLRPEAARGALIVDADGTVHGTFTLVYSDYWSPEDEKNNLTSRLSAEISLAPVVLTVTDTGLVFESVVDETIEVAAPDHTFTRAIQLPVNGRLDPETGLLELALAGDTIYVEFHR